MAKENFDYTLIFQMEALLAKPSFDTKDCISLAENFEKLYDSFSNILNNSNFLTEAKSNFPNAQELFFLSRHSQEISIVLKKAQDGLKVLKTRPLNSDEKISFEQFAGIQDLAKLHNKISKIPGEIVKEYPKFSDFCSKVIQSQLIVSESEQFVLSKTNSSSPSYSQFVPIKKPTIAEWLVALTTHLVNVNGEEQNKRFIP